MHYSLFRTTNSHSSWWRLSWSTNTWIIGVSPTRLKYPACSCLSRCFFCETEL